MFLLDTNVVSEIRKPRPHGGVMAWLLSVPSTDLHVAAVTLAEIQIGALRTRQTDATKARDIETWLDQVPDQFDILPMNGAAFRLWARYMHGQGPHLIADAMIAATATVNNLTVATRNVRDFQHWGVPVLNPFEYTANL